MSFMTPVQGTPGWFDDPTTPGITRYWDGQAWTDRSFGEPLPQGPPTLGPGMAPPARPGLFGGPGGPTDAAYPPGFVPSDQRPHRPDAITDGWAIASLVLGIIPCFWGIPAIIYGGKAKNRIRYSGGTRKGEGLATAGQILGWCWVVINVASIIIFMANGGSDPAPTYGPPTTY